MNVTHSTHKMRYSDSSFYDEVCKKCGQPDWTSKPNPALAKICVNANKPENEWWDNT